MRMVTGRESLAVRSRSNRFGERECEVPLVAAAGSLPRAAWVGAQVSKDDQ